MTRLLFVDDEQRVLAGLRRQLHAQRTAWEMEFAPGAEAALRLLANSPVDVLVTDMRMPVIDGGQLLAQVARAYSRVKVLELPFNAGKGGAMAAGARATQADILAFVDADLLGLRGEHVDTIIQPLLNHRCDMCIGVFRGGKLLSDAAQRVSPYISGQRAMRRELFDAIPFLEELRMGVEVTINTYAKRRNAKVIRVILRGVSNTHKERKMGLVKGLGARGKMYAEIVRAMALGQIQRANAKALLTKELAATRDYCYLFGRNRIRLTLATV